MKKIIGLFVLVFSLFIFSGCNIITSDYEEGTYFGYDEDSGYTAVVYVNRWGNIASVFMNAPYIKYTDGECPTVVKYGTTQCVPTTKQTLGDDYAMAATEDDKEWYEQAEMFANEVIAEQGLDWVVWSEDDETVLNVDTVSGVTMSADGMYNAVDMALKKAE